MKILGICCGRKNGNTEVLMAEAFRGVLDVIPDADCSFVNLQDADILSCVGCETCIRKKMEGDMEFRCINGTEKDHFHYLEMQMREADGIIVSTPTYNLLPPGIMIRFLNKMHAAGDYRMVTAGPEHCKVGACFSLAGTDWDDYMPNVTRMIVEEMLGSYEGLVDSVHINSTPAPRMILLDQDVMARIRQLGKNVAEAVLLKTKEGKNPVYQGMPGVCPYCHSNLLRISEEGKAFCPQCNVEAEVTVEDGRIKINFTEEAQSRSRWGEWGQKLHFENIGKGHFKAAQGKEQIQKEFDETYKALISNFRQTLPEHQ